MSETVLHSLDDYERGIAAAPLVLLFKHSPLCPVSADARCEYDAFAAAHPGVPRLFVDVIADRPVARGLAERCGVRHESPQAILFAAGKAIWNASHHDITAAALARAVLGG